MYVMGVLINCTHWQEWLEIASAMVIVLTSPTEDTVVKKERVFLTKRIQREEQPTTGNDLKDDSSSLGDEQPFTATTGRSLRDTSPFAVAVATRVKAKTSEKSQLAGSSNELFQMDLAAYLESYLFPLAPIWSGMMLGKFEQVYLEYSGASKRRHNFFHFARRKFESICARKRHKCSWCQEERGKKYKTNKSISHSNNWISHVIDESFD